MDTNKTVVVKEGPSERAEGSPPPPTTPPPADEDTQDIIIVNENTIELDLNHGRIGKIENLETLKRLER